MHHLDILADLAGAKCDTIYAQTWNPAWGEYAGDSQALVTMQFENGSRAFFEGASTNAVGLKDWEYETIRAECEFGTLVLNARRLERFAYDPSTQRITKFEGQGRKAPALGTTKMEKHLADRTVCAIGWMAASRWRPMSKPTFSRSPTSSPSSKAVGLDSRLKYRSC